MSWKILALSIGWRLGHWLVWAKCTQDAWSAGEWDSPVQSGNPVNAVLFLFHLLGLVACVYRSESESGGHEHRIPSFQVHLSLAILMIGQGHTLSYFVSWTAKCRHIWFQPGWCRHMERTKEKCNDQAVLDWCCMGWAWCPDNRHTTRDQVTNQMLMTAFNIFNLSDEHITVMEALRGVEVEGAVLVTTPQVR